MAEETSDDLRIRAQHLFSICDKEEKGFVTKRDMQRMQHEMPLEPEQLELVFDSLDADGNGYLTFDEFIQGFGIYMEGDLEETDVRDCIVQETKESTSEVDEMEDDDNFMQLLDHLGGQSVFEDEKSVKVLWDHFRQDDTSAGFQFEKFLSSISDSIHNKEQEKVTMEEFIRTQNETREEEMKRLYEEMERQIEEEKDLVIRMERMKELQLRNEMREEMAKKDQQLAQLQAREKELQEALNRVQETETNTKHDLAFLSKEKRALETQLEIQTRNAEELRASLEQLRRDSVQERRQRAMAALNVAENIAVEREGLVEQLSLLRNINTRLTDENDLREYGNTNEDQFDETANLSKEMEEASTHFGSPNRLHISSELVEGDDDEIASMIVFDPLPQELQVQVSSDSERTIIKTNSLFDELASALENNESLPSSVQPTVDLVRGEPSGAESSQPSGPNSEKINGYNSIIPTSELENSSSARISVQAASVQHEATGTIQYLRQQTSSFAWSDDESRSALLARQPKHSVTWSTNILPLADRVIESSNIQEALRSRNEWSGLNNTDSLIGYHDGQWTHRVQLRKSEPVTPSAVFKIIVLGESGVGKTSFIRRFCCDDYVHDCGSTVGIDLSIRCLPVGNGKQAALQFWDTAGQEKYRSISRQYLRKADGVVIMYDVTSVTSFLHVRYWIDCIKEVADEDVVCVLVGNKTDLLEQQEATDEATEQDGQTEMTATLTRHPDQVPTTIAMQLAQNTGLDFYETSAKTGYMIQQAVVSLAARLQIREKIAFEKAVLDIGSTDLASAADSETTKDKGKKCCRS